jgi:hypothetical protein
MWNYIWVSLVAGVLFGVWTRHQHAPAAGSSERMDRSSCISQCGRRVIMAWPTAS